MPFLAWKPIDTAPTDGRSILITWSHYIGDTPKVCQGYYHNRGRKKGWRAVWGFWLEGLATHWMPMPEPPTE